MFFVVILRICWCCCKTAKMQHVLSENLVFWGAGPSFAHHFCKLCEALFVLPSRKHFFCDFCRFGSPKGSLFKCVFAVFADFHEKERAEIEAWKMHICCFNFALIWRGRRQWALLSSYADSANLHLDSITPCPPFGGAANLKASPLPPAPLLTAAGWLAGWLALQYSDQLDGLLACWVFAILF